MAHEFSQRTHDSIVKDMKNRWNLYNDHKHKRDQNVITSADIYESLVSGRLTYPLRHAELWPYILMMGKDADGAWLQERLEKTYKAHQEVIKAREESHTTLEQLKALTFYPKDNYTESIETLFKETVKEFDCGRYTRFDEIILYLKIYLTLMHGGVLPTDFGYDTLARQLKMFLGKYKDKISALPEFERVRRETVMPVPNDEIQKYIDDIFNAAKTATGKSEQQILGKRDLFLDYISKPDRAITDWVNIPLLEQMDIDEVFGWFGDDLAAHRKFLRFLEYRYRKVIENDTMRAVDYSDLPCVKLLYEHYEKRCSELAHRFRLDYRDYDEIKKKYGELLEYMETQQVEGNQH